MAKTLEDCERAVEIGRVSRIVDAFLEDLSVGDNSSVYLQSLNMKNFGVGDYPELMDALKEAFPKIKDRLEKEKDELLNN